MTTVSRRAILLLLLAGYIYAPVQAQPAAQKDLSGIWQGALEVGAIKLRLVIELAKQGDAYRGTMKSIDQGSQAIPLSKATLVGDKAQFEIMAIGGAFEGTMSVDGKTLDGKWTQGGNTLPLILTRAAKAAEIRRPQEPRPPFPYRVEDVTYPSAAVGVTLAGTLTLPEGAGPFPVAILISGSGPQNRDEEILTHKPFLVLADYLTRRGIAVLRFDDRGVGKSTGDFQSATSRDFGEDVKGGIAYLKTRKEIAPAKIGLIGHSEGGLIAPMIAADDKALAFIVLMAGPGVPGSEVLAEQSAVIAKMGGASEEAIAINREVIGKATAIAKTEPDDAAARKKLEALMDEVIAKLPPAERKGVEERAKSTRQQLASFASPWFRFFLTFDPRTALKRVSCPVLAINGEKDLQVIPRQNLPEIEKALKEGGNTRFTGREFPGLNHLFQTSKTGLPNEYGEIEETIAPITLKTMGDWIVEVTK